MTMPSIDPESLTVEERLAMIEQLWIAIAADAERGDPAAIEAMEFDEKIDPELLAELERRVDDFKRDPSKAIRWEDLRDELMRKYG
jgi:putative addiction module component (TIGR02574 family)